MVLRVEFDQFAGACRKLLKVEEVYVTPRGSGSLATAADPSKDLLVAAVTHKSVSDAKAALEEAKLTVNLGEWSIGGEGLEIYQVGCELHVGAVAYHSRDAKPGLWVDAFAESRTQTQVLRAMYDELKEDGELAEVSFEEFLRLANPSVVVLSPTDLSRFVEEHLPCP